MASLFFTTTFCCMFIAAAAAAPPSPPLTLKLERAVSNQSMQQLSLHDFGRHQPGANHFTNFSLHGSYSIYEAGLYYTTVTLGTPPRSFNVMIDTGSDITWINCVRCAGCQDATILPVRLSYFDPRSSSTSSSISCSDKRCSSDFTRCNDNRCGYRLHYGDDSETSGIFTSDLLHFTTISVGSRTTGSVFG
ncbi:hypothetical protein RIF29_31884 [Crotalaria pallida]|uniref:Peptidase A1 domain-containing protein n=1 Tax=Crotalaria pallida TaxID=3830 RepID=A0AAN9EI74_CROPI